MPILYLFLSFSLLFLSNIRPSLKDFKTLVEPCNIFDNSNEKKLFISWNTKYQQLTFLTNHTSSNIEPNKALLTTYSIYDPRLNNYSTNKTSTYLIPWQFKTYKNKDRSEDIIIEESDVSTNLSACTIHIEHNKDVNQLKVLRISTTNTELNNELNLNEDYTDNNCRYFFTPNYFFLSYECKDYYIINPLTVGAFELGETVLNDMKNYFTQEEEEEEEEKNIDYQIFVYEWNPEENFEFKIDNNEFIIKYNHNSTITIANKKRPTTEYLLPSQKSEILNLKVQTSDLKNSNTDIQDTKIIDPIFYNNQPEDLTCFNQSHVSIFSFNQKEPIDMKEGYFLDFKEKNFFPEEAFDPENMRKIKLYLFPFDSHNKTTVYTNNGIIEFTLVSEDLLKIKHTQNNIQTTFEKNTFFRTSDGYFGWTRRCITLCDIYNLDTINHTNGYVLDQTKYPFLNTITLNDQAFNSCNYIQCPQKDKPHFHEKFPSLLIIPHEKNGESSFINHLNNPVVSEITNFTQNTKNQPDNSFEDPKKANRSSLIIPTVDNTDPKPTPPLSHPKELPITNFTQNTINQTIIPRTSNENSIQKEISGKRVDNQILEQNTSKNTAHQEKKDPKKTNRSFLQGLKIASFGVLTLFLIALIIQKGYAFCHLT